MTADGTGFNADEGQVGAPHCDLDCSGVREPDWDKHADHTAGHGPRLRLQLLPERTPAPADGRCTARRRPRAQAAWDLAARDLQAAPSTRQPDRVPPRQQDLLPGQRQHRLWYACTCGGCSNGCGATNGYMQWLTADDDNGNLNDGTPHMTALFTAFNRHGIACATPTPRTAVRRRAHASADADRHAGNFQVSLSWNAVPGATSYWVFRTEGVAGCDFGKTQIATVRTQATRTRTWRRAGPTTTTSSQRLPRSA